MVKYCPSCGTTLNYFLKTGYLGCPDCYENFKQEVESGILKIHGSIIHVGKKPKISTIDRELLNEYKRLMAEKEIAGIEGRFSDMTEINRDLNELIKELTRRGLK